VGCHPKLPRRTYRRFDHVHIHCIHHPVMSLLQWSDESIILHGGGTSHFKIDCDFLTDEDIATAARLILPRVRLFSQVHSIPRGGDRLAAEMTKYLSPQAHRVLLVDDVFTTGKSMAEARSHLSGAIDSMGCVLFARYPTPPWIISLFTMTSVHR
jgi:hypothetical protein